MNEKYYQNSQFPQRISWKAKSDFPIRIKRQTNIMNTQLYKSKRLNKCMLNCLEVYSINRIMKIYLNFMNYVSCKTRFVMYTDGRMHCSNEQLIIQCHKRDGKFLFCQNLYQQMVVHWLQFFFFLVNYVVLPGSIYFCVSLLINGSV